MGPTGGLFFEYAAGNDGDDYIDANSATGSAYLHGGNDDDVIDGSPFDDAITGGPGEDYLFGHDGKDEIYGGAGPDMLAGGAHDDILWSGGGLGAEDQPYDGVLPPGGIPGAPDMKGTGQAGCDKEDDHPDRDPGCVPVAVDDSFTMVVGPELHAGVLENDSNPIGMDTRAALVTGSTTTYGALTFYDTGFFIYDPYDDQWEGTDTFQYVAVDFASGIESDPATVTITVDYGEMLVLDQSPGTASFATLTMAQLAPLASEAIRRWRDAGVDDAILNDRLQNLAFEIQNLPGTNLASATSSGQIVIDANGAGHGWFVDATPESDREFGRQTFATERVALPGSEVYGHVDLLTVLQHEIGHLLGLDHNDLAGNVMQDSLSLSTRRWATAVDAALLELLYEASQRERRQ